MPVPKEPVQCPRCGAWDVRIEQNDAKNFKCLRCDHTFKEGAPQDERPSDDAPAASYAATDPAPAPFTVGDAVSNADPGPSTPDPSPSSDFSGGGGDFGGGGASGSYDP